MDNFYKPRYVTSVGISAVAMLIAEMMMRNDPNKSTSFGNQIFVNGAILNGEVASVFHNHSWDRVVWVIRMSSKSNKLSDGWLMWFGGFDDDSVRTDEGNLIPNRLVSKSATYIHTSSVLKAVEDYVINGVIPDDAMPGGHLESLTG